MDGVSAQIVSAGANLIAAVNASRSVSEPKEKIEALVAQAVQQSESIKAPLGMTDQDLSYYQDALEELSRRTEAVREPSDMPEWAVSFGHVLDVQRVICQKFSTRGV